jgi:hypothetical protein
MTMSVSIESVGSSTLGTPQPSPLVEFPQDEVHSLPTPLLLGLSNMRAHNWYITHISNQSCA